jgi:tyrosinase
VGSPRSSMILPSDADLRRGALSRRQRAAYISAVKCLQTKPSKAPADFIPGSRSRFDDFMGVHINQTFDVHFNVFAPVVSSNKIRQLTL